MKFRKPTELAVMWPARRDVWFPSTAASVTNILCQDIYYLKKTGIKLTIIGKMIQKLKLCKSDCEGESSVAIILIVVVTDGTGSGWGNDTSLKRCKSPRNATIETCWPRNRSIFRCRLNSGLAFLYPPGDVECVDTDQSLPMDDSCLKSKCPLNFPMRAENFGGGCLAPVELETWGRTRAASEDPHLINRQRDLTSPFERPIK